MQSKVQKMYEKILRRSLRKLKEQGRANHPLLCSLKEEYESRRWKKNDLIPFLQKAIIVSTGIARKHPKEAVSWQ